MSEAKPCFFEVNPGLALRRRAGAEAIGTLLLMLAVAGSGLVGAKFPGALLISAVAVSGTLVGLILAFGAVSGGHFNPIITGLQFLRGERSLPCTLAYITAQCTGAVAGSLLARLLFGLPRMAAGAPDWRLAISECAATAGLMVVVFGVSAGSHRETGPFGVGAWLTGAILATPSGSYANPAIAVAAMFAAGPAALSPATALAYVPAQIGGGLVALLVIRLLYGVPAAAAASPSEEPSRVSLAGPRQNPT